MKEYLKRLIKELKNELEINQRTRKGGILATSNISYAIGFLESKLMEYEGKNL